MQSGRSLIKTRKGRGPKTVPYGTLLSTWMLSDVTPSTVTCWTLSVRNDLIHSRVLPLISKLSIFRKRRSCGTRSNALEKSSTIRSCCCPLSRPDTSSYTPREGSEEHFHQENGKLTLKKEIIPFIITFK